MMEIKPHILYKVIFHPIHYLSECCADAELWPLLVDQIDENLLLISSFNLWNMFMSEGERLVSVLMNPHSRAPLHGRFLTPQGWDRAACLHIGSDPHSISLLVESDNVLGLYKICNIAFFIDSSYNKSTTWSSAIFLRNQSKVLI